jgi:hypothetical protein
MARGRGVLVFGIPLFRLEVGIEEVSDVEVGATMPISLGFDMVPLQ